MYTRISKSGGRSYPTSLRIVNWVKWALTGSHLPGAPRHFRAWRLSDTELVLTDRVEGGGAHRIEARFHLAPAMRVEIASDGAVLVTQRQGLPVLTPITDGATPAVEPSSWHPRFGQSPAQAGDLPTCAYQPAA